MIEKTVIERPSREVLWQVAGVSWRVVLTEGAPVRIIREAEEWSFPASELVPLAESLRLLNKRGPARQGRPWTTEDDTELARRFDEGEVIGDLSHDFERSRGAITARLVKLGKIEDKGQRRWPLAE